VIFKPFHVHTWYSVLDNLSYAQIKIYDLNHTAATSSASLLRAVVTKGDGSGNSLYDPRTTGEMYPVYGDRWKDNELVPIPLQAINIQSYAKKPYSEYLTRDVPDLGTIVTMAHLNVTVRVWWETVLVDTTFYVGADLTDPGPDFVYWLVILVIRDACLHQRGDWQRRNYAAAQRILRLGI